MTITASLVLMVALAVLLGSATLVAVIVAVPTVLAVTSPALETLATVLLLLAHVTFWLLELLTVALSCCVPPRLMVALV